MSTKIMNPILPGFHPDPSILCVGEDYYIATSTFEWFPGVQIYHSKDLANWKLLTRPLTSIKQLDMKGIEFSDGVWAPCLSYNNGTFYLIYTVVHSSKTDPFKDTPNYLVTARDIMGPWSEPVYLNSSGFDPSLFHDEDGRKWLVNMEWDYRKAGSQLFSGILLQEYDEKKKCLTGEIYKISRGTEIARTEGPHLYKKDGCYYLMMAEGGTSYQHAISLARSKTITGPYEFHPQNPILTAWEGSWPNEDIEVNAGSSLLKKAGHGSICKAMNGNWYLVHLCARPVEGTLSCVLGRETAIQEILWKEDGWCYLKNGGNKPADFIEIDDNIEVSTENSKEYHFWDYEFMTDFQTLRLPYDSEYMSIESKKGYLTLRGRESIYSRFAQTLLARRQTDFSFEASTIMEFEPESFMHMAGLIYRYNEDNQYYIFMSYDEVQERKTINVIEVNDRKYQLLEQAFTDSGKVEFKLKVHGTRGQFYYRRSDTTVKIGPEFDTTILSDEYARPMGFTGAFVGICAQDLQGQKAEAHFQNFLYIAE